MKKVNNTSSKSSAGKDNKKNQKRLLQSGFILLVFKIELALLIGVLFTVTGIMAGLIIGYARTTREVTPEILDRKFMPAVVYDIKGNEYDTGYTGSRIWVDYKDIPENLKNAFVAVEDERYWYHNGIDIIRIAGVTYKLFIRGNVVGGASTITQQVVKNLTGDDDMSLKRKVQEQWRAIQLEKVAGKERILEMYLNMVYLGEGINGVGAAARLYFDKEVGELTLSECASIAAIARRPTSSEPFNNPNENLRLRNIVLSKMLELDMSTQEEYGKAINEELVTQRGIMKAPEIMPFFVEETLQEVQKALIATGKYSEQEAKGLIDNGGLRIQSTLDPDIQYFVDDVFNNEDKYFPVYYGLGNDKNPHGERPQGAMVIIDPHTGEVKALAGSRGEKKTNFILNYATREKRQPGSTIKPMGVYSPLIESGEITAATVFEDLPLYLNGYHPHNYTYNYRGLTNVREAILHSTNVVAVKVWLMLGADRSHDFLTEKLGISGIRTDPKDPLNDRNAAMALGGLTDGITLKDMTASYMPLANSGRYNSPHFYTKVEDARGKTILQVNTESVQVISDKTAYIMTAMLRDIVDTGTAGPARLNGGRIASAGKTGTSSGYRDRWFVGYTPYYVAGVWYGFTPNRWEFSGEGQALAVYADVMKQIHRDLPDAQFREPEGLVRKEICIDSGKLPGPYCGLDPRGNRVRTEIFIPGTEPAEICDVHQKVSVCLESYTLATEKCPAWLVRDRITIRRLETHDTTPCREEIACSSEITLDKPFEAPTQYCQLH